MRDYQRRKNNKYILPTPVYHQTVWFIRDYDRITGELETILLESPDPPDGMPPATSLSDEVAMKAAKREGLLVKKNAVDAALEKIPPEYRRGVWENIQYRRSFPLDAGRATYARHKSRFIYEVALSMNFIDKK